MPAELWLGCRACMPTSAFKQGRAGLSFNVCRRPSAQLELNAILLFLWDLFCLLPLYGKGFWFSVYNEEASPLS